MMDDLIVEADEAAYHVGIPMDAGAVLLIELDGPEVGLDEELACVSDVCRAHGVREIRVAWDQAERDLLWKCRKRAFGAVGRLARNYCTQDGVVPRTKVPEILRRIAAAATKHDLRIGNVFHAGDGNIHPIILFDERDQDQVRRVLAAGREILEACVALGGSVTGEHGIGIEKRAQMPLLFSEDDLAAMKKLRAVFDPEGRANPHKIFPDSKVCVETRAPRRQVPL
jgi:glycolate oxidase